MPFEHLKSVLKAYLMLCLPLFLLCKILGHSRTSKRKGVKLVAFPTRVGWWLSALHYLIAGPRILQRAYRSGTTIALPTLNSLYIFLSLPSHLREFVRAPEEMLSLYSFMTEVVQPKHTLEGLTSEDSKKLKTIVRSLPLGIKQCLDDVEEELTYQITRALQDTVSRGASVEENWIELPSLSLMKRLIAAANGPVIFGRALAEDEEFKEAAVQFPDDLAFTAEILRVLPANLRPWVSRFIFGIYRSRQVLWNAVAPIVERYVESVDDDSRKPVCTDHLPLFIRRCQENGCTSTKRIVSLSLGLWYASLHQTSFTLFNAIDDLCVHPEYIEPLRQELNELHQGIFGSIDHLPLLDSFLKESSRLHPTDSISTRRTALQSFSFSDGTHVLKGDCICVATLPILTDPKIYPNSLQFDGYRFAVQPSPDNSHRFSKASLKYPVWGLGDHVCPGRHWAIRVMKIIFAHMICNYDIKLPPNSDRDTRYFSWRNYITPSAKANLLLRKRENICGS